MNDSYTEVACVVIVDNGRGKFQATVEPGQPVGETPRSTHWEISHVERLRCRRRGNISSCSLIITQFSKKNGCWFLLLFWASLHLYMILCLSSRCFLLKITCFLSDIFTLKHNGTVIPVICSNYGRNDEVYYIVAAYMILLEPK